MNLQDLLVPTDSPPRAGLFRLVLLLTTLVSRFCLLTLSGRGGRFIGINRLLGLLVCLGTGIPQTLAQTTTVSADFAPCTGDWVGNFPNYRFYRADGTRSTTFVTGELIYNIAARPDLSCKSPSVTTYVTPNLPGSASVVASLTSSDYDSAPEIGIFSSKTCQKIGPTLYTYSRNQAFRISTPGTYTIPFANSDGTTVELTILDAATAPPQPPISLSLTSSVESPIEPGKPVTFTATPQNLLSTPYISYVWTVNNVTAANQTVSSPATSATYSTAGLATGAVFQAKMVPGCGAQNTYFSNSFTVCTPPSLLITPSSQTITSGGSVTLTASGATTYKWSDGSTQNPLVLTNVTSATTLSVTGTTGGCSATASAGVSVTASGPTLGVSNFRSLVLGPGNCPGKVLFDGTGKVFTVTGPGGYTGGPFFRSVVTKTDLAISNITQAGVYTVQVSGNPGQPPFTTSFTVTGSCP